MGCVNSRGKKEAVLSGKLSLSPENREYPRQAHISIRHLDESMRVRMEPLSFSLTDPMVSNSKKLVKDREYWASACVLPGMDPRSEIDKKCQDYCFFSSDEDSILIVLFDGHGAEGEKVVEFCSKVAEDFYRSSKSSDPTQFLVDLTERCHSALQKESSIDVTSSGCTAVLVYFYNGYLYCASVGDSRAILGTLEPPKHSPAPEAQMGEERKMLEVVKERRKSFLTTQIFPVQLTRDQKPEDPDELARIVKAGGRVQKITDKKGNKVGPYRVWELNANTPGLAMSRSIGDTTGHKLGVISTPVTTKHQVNDTGDLFIVAASDGIWDVMENEDVVTFVECYREKCLRDLESPTRSEIVSCKNSTIAQLLCEEARVRWYTIVENEDVMIDDISCVVLELQGAVEDVAHVAKPLPDRENKELPAKNGKS